MSRYGCRRDTRDARDFAFRLSKPGPIPSSIDLRQWCPPVMDQGDLGACTAHAITAALRWNVIKLGGKADAPLSRLALYYDERAREGTVREDAGAEIRTGIKSVRDLGVPLESEWAYDPARFDAKPPPSIYDDAWLWGSLAYERVLPATLRTALATGNPVVIGVSLYESFEGDAVAKNGVVPMPDLDKESLAGGHAILAVGYTPTSYVVMNSWGDGWGDKGFCYFPRAYLESISFGSDYWLIRPGGLQ